MKAVLVGLAVFAACSMFGAPKDWSEREAIAEARHDIHANKVKFYWWGGYAPQPVGVDFRVACRYPKVIAGQGCVVYDEALNERQRKYAETYNARVLVYVLKKN